MDQTGAFGGAAASKELERASRHSVWPVERAGDLLIVAPRGDLAGFSVPGFRSEFDRVVRLSRNPAFRHVLVDLGAANYFGSELIGALVDLGRVVGDRGRPAEPVAAPVPDPASGNALVEFVDSGRTAGGGEAPEGRLMAVCSVSPDMQAGLSVMGVDRLWAVYPDRKAAVADLAKITVRDRAASSWRPLAAVGGLTLLAAVVAALAMPSVRDALFPPTAEDDLAALESTDRRWRRRLNSKANNEELAREGTRLMGELDWAVRRLKSGRELSQDHEETAVAGALLREWMRQPADSAAKDAYRKALQDARQGVSD